MKLKSNSREDLQAFIGRQVKISMCFKNHTKKQAAKEMRIDYKHFCGFTRDYSRPISLDILLSFCDYCDIVILDSIKKANPLF